MTPPCRGNVIPPGMLNFKDAVHGVHVSKQPFVKEADTYKMHSPHN